MKDWRTRLRDADSVRQADTPPADVVKVRNAVLAAARPSASPARSASRRPIVLAAAVLVMIGAGAATVTQIAGRKTGVPVATDRPDAPGAATGEEPDSPVDRQQLQFATPGGTRIIWVFDSNFQVKRPLP